MVANADKVAFVAADNTYTGDATQVVVLPSGFDTDVLSATSDAVMFSKFVKSSYVTSATFRVVAGANPTITPAKGVTITGIKFTAQTTSNFGVFTDFTLSTDKLSQTSGTVAYTEATELANTKQARITVIEVEYTGAPAVKMPTISADYDYVLPADKTVTLSAEAGAKIYYTLDGTEPTEASTLYTAPFALEKTGYVRAIAVTDNGTSFVASKGYVSVPAGVQIATYNFTDMNSITAPGHNITVNTETIGTDADTSEWVKDSSNFKIELDSLTFTADKTSVIGIKNDASNAPRLYLSNTFGGLTQYRLYAGNTVTYSVTDDNYYVAAVVQSGGVGDGLSLPEGGEGAFEVASIYTGTTSRTGVWTAKDGAKNSSATLAIKTGAASQFYQQIYIAYAPKDESGIEGVAVDNSNAPVEFYNLQGVRVANPTNGIYVKRQGNTATKVLVK
jgi:hypothetical protein